MSVSTADTSGRSIVTDAAVEHNANTAQKEKSSYFYGGAERALLSFVSEWDAWQCIEPSDPYVKRFIQNFCQNPQIDVGVEYIVPCCVFDEFSSDINRAFDMAPEIVCSELGEDLIDRMELLDPQLMRRHVPAYFLPWREERPLYWHTHWQQLLKFVMTNPLLELALRKSS